MGWNFVSVQTTGGPEMPGENCSIGNILAADSGTTHADAVNSVVVNLALIKVWVHQPRAPKKAGAEEYRVARIVALADNPRDERVQT